jgi:hypothetical protein
MGSDVEGLSIVITGSCEPTTTAHRRAPVCRDTIGRSGNPIPKWRITVALSPYVISALCTLHSALCTLHSALCGTLFAWSVHYFRWCSWWIHMYLLPIPPLIRSLFQMVFLVDPYVPPAYPTPQPGARLLPDPLPRVLMAIHRPLPGFSLKIRWQAPTSDHTFFTNFGTTWSVPPNFIAWQVMLLRCVKCVWSLTCVYGIISLTSVWLISKSSSFCSNDP